MQAVPERHAGRPHLRFLSFAVVDVCMHEGTFAGRVGVARPGNDNSAFIGPAEASDSPGGALLTCCQRFKLKQHSGDESTRGSSRFQSLVRDCTLSVYSTSGGSVTLHVPSSELHLQLRSVPRAQVVSIKKLLGSLRSTILDFAIFASSSTRCSVAPDVPSRKAKSPFGPS